MSEASVLGPWGNTGENTWTFNAKGPVKKMTIERGDGNIDTIIFTGQGLRGIARAGIWGDSSGGDDWSFLLESDHKLRKISIDHEDWLYSLMFTTEDPNGELHPTKMFGGWNGPSGGETAEINFDDNEEIIGINGTVGVSTGTYAGYTVISSLSFVTNKKTHGPFGQATGTAFSVPWDRGSFSGFYGRAGYYMDGIGVYLKATM